jgi:hypothetical protein
MFMATAVVIKGLTQNPYSAVRDFLVLTPRKYFGCPTLIPVDV